MDSEHTQLVMWIVGTGVSVLLFFIGILIGALSTKVDIKMCDKVHEMLDSKFNEMSQSVKETSKSVLDLLEKIHTLNLSVISIKSLLEGQIRAEDSRWDRTEKDKKG